MGGKQRSVLRHAPLVSSEHELATTHGGLLQGSGLVLAARDVAVGDGDGRYLDLIGEERIPGVQSSSHQHKHVLAVGENGGAGGARNIATQARTPTHIP